MSVEMEDEGSGIDTASNGSATDIAESAEPTLVDYLGTERGHQVTNRLIELFEGVKKATLDENAKEKHFRAEGEMLAICRGCWLKSVGLFGVVAATVSLSAFDKLTLAAETMLGTLAGYLFGCDHFLSIARPKDRVVGHADG